MRYRWLFFYWLAVAATGAACFFIPVAGWALGLGAFGYLGTALPCWMLMGGLFAHMEYRRSTFGIDNRRFARLIAGCAVLACGCGLWSGQPWLATGGAGFLFLTGEWVVMDRMFRERDARTGA